MLAHASRARATRAKRTIAKRAVAASPVHVARSAMPTVHVPELERAAMKPKARARARATPAAASKKRVSAPTKGLRFQSRGAHRCVQVDGANQTGVHNALTSALYPEWDYDAAERAGTLQRIELPKPTHFVPMPPAAACARRGPPQSSAKGGCKLDAQLTTTVALHVGPYRVPSAAFYDKIARDAHIRAHMQGAAGTIAARRLRTTCRNLLAETAHAWRAFVRLGLDPRSTQDIVACRGVGTRVDVVARDALGHTRVLEMKRGCTVAFGNGRRMRAPYQSRVVSTHDHYLLQTLVNHKLYRATHPAAVLGAPLLVRIDADGAHVYAPPAWALEKLADLMRLLYR